MCTADSAARAIMAGFALDVSSSEHQLSAETPRQSLMSKTTVAQDTARTDFDAGSGQRAQVEVFAPAEFRAFRDALLMENEACVKEWDFGEGGGAALCKGTGKSGSLFRPSVNKKMLLKTIPKMEKNTLMKLLARYFQYILTNPDSLIMRLLGLFRMTVGGQSCFVLVIENLFANVGDGEVTVFDLKGRKAKPKKIHGDSHGKTISDNTIGGRRFWMEGDFAKGCIQQLVSDVGFLRDINIMDYSLLVGIVNMSDAPAEPNVTVGSKYANGVPSIDKYREKYFIGIIDCLTEYNWKKIAANCMKTTCCYRAEFLSTVPAQPYAERWLAMSYRVFSDEMHREIRRASAMHQLEPEFERQDSEYYDTEEEPPSPTSPKPRASIEFESAPTSA